MRLASFCWMQELQWMCVTSGMTRFFHHIYSNKHSVKRRRKKRKTWKRTKNRLYKSALRAWIKWAIQNAINVVANLFQIHSQCIGLWPVGRLVEQLQNSISVIFFFWCVFFIFGLLAFIHCTISFIAIRNSVFYGRLLLQTH